jgi:diguanylate cyclase (GGDEF)-like protein/PAS domain S-box-containing protein
MERQSKVLVVDDDQFALRSIADVLGGESYQVVTATGGSEALDLLKQDSFDLVLTDLKMPEVDGLEVLRQARETAPQAVVLILTGYAALESAIEALREGAYDYLVKPCSGDELKLRIERGLERVRLAEERQRAGEEIRQHTAQLEALRQVGLEITAELDLDALLHSIASRATKLVRGTSGGLYLYRPNRDVLEWSVSVGPDLTPVGTVLHRGEGLSGKVWETGEPLIVDDYQQWEGRVVIYECHPSKATVGVPVRWGEEFLGVLNVLADPPRTFSPADAELLSLFANQAAIAIQNARLYEEARRRALEQETVSRIAYALNTPDVRDAFPVLVKGLQDLIDCDEVSLIALDEAGEQFITTVLESPFPIPGEGEVMPLSATAAAEDVEASHPHLTADLSTETHFPIEQALYRAGLRSRVTLPLLIGGEVFGALNLGGSDTGLFREDQLPVFQQIADAVALALENSFLFQAEREQRERAEALEEAAAIVSSTLDPDQVLDRILEQVSRVVPNDAANVMLIGGDQVRIVRCRGYERFGAEEFVSTVVFRIPEVPNFQQMADSKEPMAIPDTATYPGWLDFPPQEWLHSYAGAPIIVRGQVIGFLNVDSATPGFFTQAHAEALRAFADHAAAAIENARLYEETKRRVEEMTALHETALDITAQLEMQRLLNAIITRASDLLGATGGLVHLYDPARERLVAVTSHNLERDYTGLTLEMGEGVAGKVFQTGQPLIIDDHRAWAGRSPQVEDAFARSVLGVPLKWREQVIGVLDIMDNVRVGAFDEQDLRLLMLFANQAAIAIENARLYEAEQERRHIAETLRQASTVLSSTLELDEVLELILQQLRQVIPYDSASVQRLQDAALSPSKGEYLEIMACQGFEEPDKVVGLVFPLDPKFPNYRVTTTKAPLAIKDIVQDYPHFKEEADTYESGRICSWLGVPLMVRDEVIGMIAMDRAEVRPYTTEEAQLAAVFANQAAIAIENARLHAETERRLKEQIALREAGAFISSALDSQTVLTRIAEQMCQAIDATSAYISSYEPATMIATVLAEYFSPQACTEERVSDLGASYPEDAEKEWIELMKAGQHDVSHVDDPDLTKSERAHMQQYGAQTVLYIPLRIKGGLVGYAELWESRWRREFTPEEISLCHGIAQQAAIAIQNARLFEEERRRATQLALINEVGEKAVSILDLDGLMQGVTRSIQESFNYYNVAFFLLSEERREVVMQAVAGGFEHIAAGEYRQSLDEGIIGFTARTGKSWLANDVSKDPYYIKGFVDEVLTQSELCVPVKLGDKVIGALDVQSTHLNDFDQSDVVAMEAVADRVAIAMENARLYEETRERATELSTLYEVVTAGMTSVRLDKILDRTMTALQETLQPDDMAILLVEPETNELVIHAHTGFPGGPQLLRRDIGVGVPGWVVQTGQPVLLADVREDERYHACDPDTRSELCVPLRVGERIIGALNLESRRLAAFNGDDLRLLSILAGHLAAVIENARLFEEIEERRLYLEGVLGAAPDAIVALDARHRIVEWNPGAERLFGYSWEEVIGQNIDDLITSPDVFDEAVGFTQVVMSGEEVPPIETVRYRKDGSPVDVLLAGSPIMVGDELIGVVAVYTDITARVRAEEQLAYIATHDPLTGVPNRLGFLTLAEQQLKMADRAKKRMVLLFADFDHLKRINDTFGHSEGDRALIEVADVLEDTFRESDIIGRIAGDEFVVLAIETDGDSAEILATRLQENLEARNAKADRRYDLSLSVGIARYDPEYPCSIDELLARADRAMYEQKQGNQKS